uniref:Penicillin-binding protein 2 n=1 Tax=Dictyoglomus thermophilum TaxID=14 RepID=A0A7C3RRL0_DICTH
MNIIRARIFLTFWIITIFFIEIFIIILQLGGGISYSQTRTKDRGIILDRNGEEIVFNVKRKSLAINPKGIESKERKKIISILSNNLKLSSDELYKKIDLPYEFVWIKRMLSDEDVKRIEKYVDNKKIILIDEPYRTYPIGIGISNLIGFVGVDNQGLSGLEAYFDSYLRNGYSIYLTIDKNLQELLTMYLREYMKEYNADNAFGGIMDLNTGEIIALTTLPEIDLSRNLDEIIEQNNRFRNLLNTVLEPGSLFKVVTTAIALEEKLVDVNFSVYCKGEEIIDGYKVRCTEHHGLVNIEDALVRSCNIYFYYLAKKIPASIWEKYFKLLGLDSDIPLDVKIFSGDTILPDVKSSIVMHGTLGFGHGIGMTPLKMLWTLSFVGNDGFLVKPKLIKKIENNGKTIYTSKSEIYRQVFSKDTSLQTLNYMFQVVKRGTANILADLNYKIAGKTGTAQVSGKFGYTSYYNHFFLGYLFLDDKKYCILVMLDKPKKGRFARETVVPIFGEIVNKLSIYGRLIN